jgi:flagellar basal body rod protein FlgG
MAAQANYLAAVSENISNSGTTGYKAMSRLMLKSAKRALLIENLRILRGLGKMRVR